jgi:hypothetical protein
MANPPAEGSLTDLDVTTVVGSICARRFTGALVLGTGGAERTVHWKEGRIVAVASTHPDDTPASLLLMRGRLPLARHASFDMGQLEEPEQQRTRDEVAERVLAAAFAATHGTYRLREGADVDGLEVHTATGEIVMDALQRVDSWSRVESALGGAEARYHRTARHEEVLADLPLSFERMSVILDLHGERSVASICADSTLPDFEVCRLLWVFRTLAAIVRVDIPTHIDVPLDDEGLGDVLAAGEDEAVEAKPDAVPATAEPVPPGRRLLLVALDGELSACVEPMLSRASFSVERVPDSASALAACTRERFDLVMVAEPVSDPPLGDLLEAFRKMRRADHVLVAVAASELASVRARLGERSELAVLVKDPTRLLEEVASRLLGVAHRVATRMLVKLEVRVADTRSRVLLQTENVSDTGMLLRTDQVLPIGTLVNLEFQLPDDRNPVTGQAEVVRHTLTGVEKVTGMAVRYLGFRGDGQQRLEAWLATRGKE